jgi:hypothetical protein
VTALAQKIATVLKRSTEQPAAGKDYYGNPKLVETPLQRQDYPAALAPEPGFEVEGGRDTSIALFRVAIFNNGFGLPDLDANDQLIIDGVTYQVDGPPIRGESFQVGEDHLEARLRAVVAG